MVREKTMVVIEDEVDLRQMIAAFFRRKGWVVRECGTLTEGIHVVDEVQPAVLFLDNNLPDGLGWDAAPVLAARNPKMHTHLISGFHPAPPAMPEGVEYFVHEKPISFSQFDFA
ncbi:MAG: response regulator [Sphingobacteriales bacterium]|nr:MAG: response regulator [Sphingobacteriales bacterium]